MMQWGLHFRAKNDFQRCTTSSSASAHLQSSSTRVKVHLINYKFTVSNLNREPLYFVEKHRRSVTTTSHLEIEYQQPASAPETTRYNNVGKVRQLFAERRKQQPRLRSTIVGRDKSYPLRPLRRDDDTIPAENQSLEYKIVFNEINTPNNANSVDLVRISSWPTINNSLDTSIFGRLPNLGGTLLSERRSQTVASPAQSTRMATTARGVNLLPSRIPQKTTTPSVDKVTSKISSLNLSGPIANVKNKSSAPSPQRTALTIEKVHSVPAKEKKIFVTPNRVITQSRPGNGLPNINAPVKKKTEPAMKVKTPPGMVSCKVCGRHFASDRIQKHEEICEKSSKKKRKVFDPLKQRLKGTEAENMLRQIKKSIKTPEQPKRTNWRKQHEDFITNIKAARQVKEHLAKGGKLSDLPPPPPLDTSSYVPCPHCGRKFNEPAAERHIGICATMRHNKPKPGLAKNDKQIRNKMIVKRR